MYAVAPNPFSMAADLFRAGAAARRAAWQPLAHQVPPAGIGGRDWMLWLLLGGRGSGKTDAMASYVDRYARDHPGARVRIIAPTLADAREACVEGPSGLLAHNAGVSFNVSKSVLRWPNGSRARLFGAHTPEDVERLRAGGNADLDWYEELAAWRYLGECLDQAEFGLRLGPNPHAVASTTPKPKARLRALMQAPTTRLVRARTDDNPHLSETRRAQLYATYGGTRIGRQELEAEYLDDVPGALWTHNENVAGKGVIRYRPAPLIRRNGVDEPNLARVVVAVDPNASSEEGADEAGITVHGLAYDRVGYLLADRSAAVGPTAWAKRARQAAEDFKADSIVAERNNGGEMVEITLRAAGYTGRVVLVNASRGKRTRAEPVSMLYEQARIFHVEPFPELEDQLTSWTPESGDSPDRLDACVWGWTELLLGGAVEGTFSMVA